MAETDLASIGETGGMTGSFTVSLWSLVRERVGPVRKLLPSFGLSNTQMLDAFLQRGDLAEPRSVLRLCEALLGVLGHLVDAAQLSRVNAQKPASVQACSWTQGVP